MGIIDLTALLEYLDVTALLEYLDVTALLELSLDIPKLLTIVDA